MVYRDDPLLPMGQTAMEHAYGAAVHALAADAEPPARPRVVPGALLHLDVRTDARLLLGERNPMVDFLAVRAELTKAVDGLVDIDDKWDEYRFLRELAPRLAPPRMELASTFAAEPISGEERARARRAVERTRAAGAHVPAAELTRLEVLRLRMHDALGRSILKVRDLSHSEGKLPATDADWCDLYVRYARDTKRDVERLEREVAGSSQTLESRALDLPNISGRVLELLLADPARIVAQSTVRIRKEVRLHIVEGRILAGATFLRFYPLGGYLAPEEIGATEHAVATELLARLPEPLARFSCSPDVILEEGTGRIRILDLNAGIESGYYYPEEDVITTNLLAEQFTGERPPFLAELDRALAPGARRAARIARFVAQHARLFDGDVLEAFWGRVLAPLVREVGTQPDAAGLEAALATLKAAGVPNARIVHQLVAEVQDRFPRLVLARPRAVAWARWLDELEPAVTTYLSSGRLHAAPADPAPRRTPRRAPAGLTLAPARG